MSSDALGGWPSVPHLCVRGCAFALYPLRAEAEVVGTLVDTAEGLITKELGKFGSEAHLFDYRLPQGPLG